MSRSQHALFPGSFDPVTRGHLDLVQRARRLFDRVTVAVAAHHGKTSVFEPEARVVLLREALGEATDVDVVLLDGLLVDGARTHGATTIVRGVRDGSDLDYEASMARTNRDLDPDLETVFLLPAPELAHVSSSLVRQIARMGGDVSPFVPPHVVAALQQRLGGAS